MDERISHCTCRHQPRAPRDDSEYSHTNTCPNRSNLLPALQGSCPKAIRCCWSTWSIINDRVFLCPVCLWFRPGVWCRMNGKVGPRLKMLWEWENIKTFIGLILPLSPQQAEKTNQPTKKSHENLLNHCYILHRQNRATVMV